MLINSSETSNWNSQLNQMSTVDDIFNRSFRNFAGNTTTSIDDIRVGRFTLDELYAIYRPSITAINKYVTPALYVVGFPGNLVSFLIWIRPRMRHSSGCYLAALAMTDLLFLTLHVCFELQFTWRAIDWLSYPGVCELFPMFFLAAQHLSPLLVLAFTVERYISICHPFKKDVFCTTSRAYHIILSMMAFSLLLNSIQAYFWSHSSGTHNTCELRSEVLTTIPGYSASFWDVYSWTAETLIFLVSPLLIVVFNSLVIAEQRKVTARERELTSSIIRSGKSRPKSAAPSATTIMLLVVSFYLIFTTLPVTVSYVLYNSFPAGNTSMADTEVLTDRTWQTYFDYWMAKVIIQEFGMSHFACNIIIYLCTGRIFRSELRKLLCGRRSKRGFSSRRTVSQVSRDLTTIRA